MHSYRTIWVFWKFLKNTSVQDIMCVLIVLKYLYNDQNCFVCVWRILKLCRILWEFFCTKKYSCRIVVCFARVWRIWPCRICHLFYRVWRIQSCKILCEICLTIQNTSIQDISQVLLDYEELNREWYLRVFKQYNLVAFFSVLLSSLKAF